MTEPAKTAPRPQRHRVNDHEILELTSGLCVAWQAYKAGSPAGCWYVLLDGPTSAVWFGRSDAVPFDVLNDAIWPSFDLEADRAALIDFAYAVVGS